MVNSRVLSITYSITINILALPLLVPYCISVLPLNQLLDGTWNSVVQGNSISENFRIPGKVVGISMLSCIMK